MATPLPNPRAGNSSPSLQSLSCAVAYPGPAAERIAERSILARFVRVAGPGSPWGSPNPPVCTLSRESFVNCGPTASCTGITPFSRPRWLAAG